MTSSGAHWTKDLPSLAACGILQKLPPLLQLRQSADNTLKLPDSSVSDATVLAAGNLFDSKRLCEAVHTCVQAECDIPRHMKPVATLLITSVAMEDYVRSHSTKARLFASRLASIHRVVQEQKAKAEETTAANEHEELLQFFSKLSKEKTVEHLLVLLKEPEEKRSSLMGLVAKYGPKDLAAIILATTRAIVEGNTCRADGTGSKTMGGVFFQEVKRYKDAANRPAIEAVLPSLPLRSYQREVVTVVLSSWGMKLPRAVFEAPGGGKAGSGGNEGEEERKGEEGEPQSRLSKRVWKWSGNWLVSSPTNSGKTRMFVEVARGVIESKPPRVGAIIVVLVPSVILTLQHSNYFESAKLPNTQLDAYSSENQLGCKAWATIRTVTLTGSSYVVVTTADSFLNLLRNGVAAISEVDLLVLDEAHHCKDNHPYCNVMSIYSQAPEARRPRVLGVTASPASEQDPRVLNARMEELLKRLHAEMYLVDSEDPEVVSVLPDPRRIEKRVKMRDIDLKIITLLQAFALTAATEIDVVLRDVRVAGKNAIKDKVELSEALIEAIRACTSGLASDAAAVSNQPLATRLDQLGQWLAKALKFATDYKCPNLGLVARLLDIIRKSIEFLEDAGFEGALPFLARKTVALCREELQVCGGFLRNQRLPSCTKPTALRNEMSIAAMQAGSVGAAPDMTAAPAAATAPLAGPSASVGPAAAANSCSVLSSLAAAAAQLKSGCDLVGKGAHSGSTAAQPRNSCDDIPLRVSKLLKDLLTSEVSASWIGNQELVEHCFLSGDLKQESTFPKFWALLQYLQSYRDKPNFHGIIFVRTRQAVFYVADMIRRVAQLQFVEVLELIGHTDTMKRVSLSPKEDRHGRGMSDSEQQQVLRLFKEPGRKVLVATSAAEEGLDVPSCEFVVRYNAAATGIQLLQSRGRARQRVSEFCVILQDGTLDTSLHHKSCLEEGNMAAWLRMHEGR
ncbi:hypothetical protein VaNZ11_008214 [Volvox africanus]|uniref:Uncharacterized protein n=1 Tax=Volvox africanus TaxID=51714 RepID=A0ABQ5S644_9CHLO|nr:hypothetical protein VaNZ11_008214 [Volvox africanus]